MPRMLIPDLWGLEAGRAPIPGHQAEASPPTLFSPATQLGRLPHHCRHMGYPVGGGMHMQAQTGHTPTPQAGSSTLDEGWAGRTDTCRPQPGPAAPTHMKCASSRLPLPRLVRAWVGPAVRIAAGACLEPTLGQQGRSQTRSP